MELIQTRILPKTTQSEIRRLHARCEQTDGYRISCFMENHYNIHSSMPCFHLYRVNGRLVGFLSVFVPNPEECEISAMVDPDYRRQGIFSFLWELAMDILSQYQIHTIYVPLSPDNQIARNLLQEMDFTLAFSEYTMCLRLPDQPSDSSLPAPYSLIQTKTGYRLLSGSTVIGSCGIFEDAGSCTICGFEILPMYRRQGYGSLFLQSLLDALGKRFPGQSVLLHVNGENTAAVSLYLRHHFHIQQQLDYWVY